MAGALTERAFVEKLHRAGFDAIEVEHHQPVSMDVLALYPLFTDDLLALMGRLLPEADQRAVATAVVVRATRARPSPG